MIDLHVHSTFSDGSYTPEELVDLACDVGLTAMALTDHDSTNGLSRFMAACEERSLTGIPGVEISADTSKGTLHIIGYYIDLEDEDFQASLLKIRDGREYRNGEILARLNELGLELTMDEVAAYAGEDVVGRPHFAQAMIDKGYVPDKQAAFDKYLAKNMPAYVDRFRLSDEDAIREIRRVGGVPVLCHPFSLSLNKSDLRAYVERLVKMGLMGIEVYYSEHSAQRVQQYLDLVAEFDLIAVGGSDFHGDVNPHIRLGKGFGNLKVEDRLLSGLERARNMVRS